MEKKDQSQKRKAIYHGEHRDHGERQDDRKGEIKDKIEKH